MDDFKIHGEELNVMENQSAFNAANAYADEHGLSKLTMQQVEVAKICASEHVDFGSRWTYAISDMLFCIPSSEFFRVHGGVI